MYLVFPFEKLRIGGGRWRMISVGSFVDELRTKKSHG